MGARADDLDTIVTSYHELSQACDRAARPLKLFAAEWRLMRFMRRLTPKQRGDLQRRIMSRAGGLFDVMATSRRGVTP